MASSLLLLVMGSILMICAGTRHLICSILAHVKFISRGSCPPAKPWYISGNIKKNVDILAVLLVLPIGAIVEIYSYSTWNGTSTVAVSYLDQAALLVSFWLLLLVIMTMTLLMNKNLETLPFGTELIFLAAGVVFVLEWIVVKRGVSGFEFEWYRFLSLVSLVCAGSCAVLALNPGLFLAEMVLASSLLLQGTWILQIACSLFVPPFMPRGCHRLSEMPVNGESPVQCILEEDKARALAFVDFIFICHVLFVLFSTVIIFLLIAWPHSSRRENINYCPIGVDSENVQMQTLPKFDIE